MIRIGTSGSEIVAESLVVSLPVNSSVGSISSSSTMGTSIQRVLFSPLLPRSYVILVTNSGKSFVSAKYWNGYCTRIQLLWTNLQQDCQMLLR